MSRRKRPHAVETLQQIGKQLFFAGNHPSEFPDVMGFFGVVDGCEELRFPPHQQQGGLLVDIGDEECGEQEFFL